MGRYSTETSASGPSGLGVKCISPVKKKNDEINHTDDYETDALVIRRGSSFSLDITHEGLDKEKNKFYLQLKTGGLPRKRDGSLIEIHNRAASKDACSFQIMSESEDSIRICVNLPASTLVSCYTLCVVSIFKTRNNKKRVIEFDYNTPVYILFNPWCEDDEVYMESEELKKEYILNDAGYVYWSGQRPKPWHFGQFKEPTLKCTFQLLASAEPDKRGNAIEVSRHISARCNSCDNDGLLVGNWSGDYSGGVPPWIWGGSVPIFKKYLSSGTSVEYGQCWVFSALTTSMMRCLGIPARSVTNYDSAHDTDNNCTFDRYIDEEGRYLEDESADSCWNFHVWNDVWMSRPDLPAGMGGWQAIDGTPQEESKGIFRCGPASLQSIREGEVDHEFDTKFVFAEVNADTVYWQRDIGMDGETSWVAVRIRTNSVGSALLTKAPNKLEKENITYQYKYSDGSLLERAAVRKALKKVDNPVIEERPQDVMFSSKIPWNVCSEDFIKVQVNAVNDTSKPFTIHNAVTAQVVRYNGVKVKSLEIRSNQQDLKANSTISFDYQYDAREYVEHLDENISIRFVIVSRVIETKQVYVSQKICNVHKSELTLEAVGKDDASVRGGETLTVKISIPSVYGLETYTKCSLEVDCPLVENVTLELEDMAADGTAVIEKPFTIKHMKKAKESELVATFNSKEISGIHGVLKLDVAPCR